MERMSKRQCQTTSSIGPEWEPAYPRAGVPLLEWQIFLLMERRLPALGGEARPTHMSAPTSAIDLLAQDKASVDLGETVC